MKGCHPHLGFTIKEKKKELDAVSLFSGITIIISGTYYVLYLGMHLTRSRGVFSRMSTILSNLVFSVKMKSSSTHSTYLVITCDTARFLPANQPCTKRVNTMLFDNHNACYQVRHNPLFTFPNGMM